MTILGMFVPSKQENPTPQTRAPDYCIFHSCIASKPGKQRMSYVDIVAAWTKDCWMNPIGPFLKRSPTHNYFSAIDIKRRHVEFVRDPAWLSDQAPYFWTANVAQFRILET